MHKLLKCELLKLKYSRSFKVLLLLSLLIGFASSGITSSLHQGQIIHGYEAFYQQFMDLRTLTFVFAGLFSGLFIGEDFSSRAVQSGIASGYSRLSILLSKTIVYFTGISILIITQVIVRTLTATISYGFGINMTTGILFNMTRAILMFMFLACACSMIYVMTSFCLKNTGISIAINMLLLVAIDGIFQAGAMFSDTGMKIYEATPFVQMLLSSAEMVSSGQIFKSVLVGSGMLLMFFTIAYLFFRKAELK